MAEIVYVRDANWNLVQTTIEDLREERLRGLEEENKKLKEKVETLELWLDNKEKLNEEYRKQIDKLKEKYGDIDY